MDDLLIRSKLQLPVTTGLPAASGQRAQKQGVPAEGPSFQQVLKQKERDCTQTLSFSKHAAERVASRNITLSQADLEKLSQGVQMAREKGMNGTLILMNGSAFIVSAKNGRVITALNGQEADGKVVTNIEGAVIL